MWKYVTFLADSARRPAKAPILTALALIGLFTQSGLQAREIELDLGGKAYRIELALTGPERRLGLMYRQRLAPDEGMLLVYRDSGDHRIWMKNVEIPLRVFWIDSRYEVVAMQRLEPCREEPCPVFSAGRDSRFVLELSDDAHNLAPGDVIDGLKDI